MKAYIVDDEIFGIKALKSALATHCPDVELAGTFQDAAQAIQTLQQDPPDILFLDINLNTMSGFDVLKQLDPIEFSIIFTTAHDQYALDAFKVDAVDYLIKPIDHQELIDAVDKCRQRSSVFESTQLESLMSLLKKNVTHTVIRVPSQKGFDFYQPEEIIYCQSDSNYTMFFLTKGRKQIIAKTLKEVNQMLPDEFFLRIHQSYIVNLNHIKSYLKEDGGYVIMSNEEKVRVSKNRKEELLDYLMD